MKKCTVTDIVRLQYWAGYKKLDGSPAQVICGNSLGEFVIVPEEFRRLTIVSKKKGVKDVSEISTPIPFHIDDKSVFIPAGLIEVEYGVFCPTRTVYVCSTNLLGNHVVNSFARVLFPEEQSIVRIQYQLFTDVAMEEYTEKRTNPFNLVVKVMEE